MTKKKEPHSRETLIEQAYRNSIAYKITQATTLTEKRELVSVANPTHYIFGKTLKPYKPYLTYEENYS
jgi:hypothetical protein